MNRPAARLWAGVLVLGAVSILSAGPVRLSIEPPDPLQSRRAQPVPERSRVEPLHDAGHSADQAFDAAYTLLRGSTLVGVDRAADEFATMHSRRATLAIPLPPAVLPAGAMLGAVAIAAILRKHRRK